MDEPITLELRPHSDGGMFYIRSALLHYKFLEVGKTYRLTIEEVK